VAEARGQPAHPSKDLVRFLSIASFALLAAGCLLPPSRMSASGSAPGAGDSDHNLLANSTFEGGVSMPWTTSFTAPGTGDAAVVDGAFCVTVANAGKNLWDAQLRHRDMVIERGHHYRVSFRMWADKAMKVRPKVGMAGPPYAEYWADTIALSPKPQAFAAEFTMAQADDATAEFAFHLGGELSPGVPYEICIDDVVLEDPKFVKKRASAAVALPAIRVNQLGYLPRAKKTATWVSSATEPAAWALIGPSGTPVAEGQTRVFGADAASGDSLHVIDFSSFQTEGKGYRLRVPDSGAESHAFDIATDLYEKLRADALAFFYHQRSGVEIKLPFAGDSRWVRPPGHMHDRAVSCASDAGCDYSLDLSGGWYDAGDHGKYVVNAGVTVWTMLNQYERAQQVGRADALGDGQLKIPEAGNGVPDLLDEVRWELDFLLKMQVPAGKPLAGMAHHKMHDKAWTEIGVAPHEDKQPRIVKAPSTAATLNLAAVAAQAARVWKTIDPAFSKRCLDAAKRAFDAALAHPKMFAPQADSIGGGPYDDTDVRDEFYWAAAELLITTGDAKYREQLKAWGAQPIVPTQLGEGAGDAGQNTVLTWQNVVAAGALSLALAPASVGEERTRARSEIVKAADALVAIQAREGYGVPIAPGPGPSYPWGSNSFILNNAIVLALAHDFTREAKYLDAVVGAMDYLLGKNPLDQSYVTGYGARPLENPHHRFFAKQVRADRPAPPPGIVSGGPNSGLQDPLARSAGLAGRAPQRAFIDHIESYSTNEVTINWNAPLAWVAAFLDDSAR
jgi:endoglucanase